MPPLDLESNPFPLAEFVYTARLPADKVFWEDVIDRIIPPIHRVYIDAIHTIGDCYGSVTVGSACRKSVVTHPTDQHNSAIERILCHNFIR